MPTINKKTILLENKTEEAHKERMKYYNNSQWKKLKNIYLQCHPLCEECLKNGIVNGEHLHVHHIKSPFNTNLTEWERWQRLLDFSNLQTLCEVCHAKKHHNRK